MLTSDAFIDLQTHTAYSDGTRLSRCLLERLGIQINRLLYFF